MRYFLNTLLLFASGFAPSILLSTDQSHVHLSGRALDLIASIGLMPWERPIFGAAPNAYFGQFIAITCVVSAVNVISIAAQLFFLKEDVLKGVQEYHHEESGTLFNIPNYDDRRSRVVIGYLPVLAALYISRLISIFLMGHPQHGSMASSRTAGIVFLSPVMYCFLSVLTAMGATLIVSRMFLTYPNDQVST